MVLSSFVFLDDTSTVTTSNAMAVINGSQLTLEVAPSVVGGNVNITIEGRVDTDTQNWTALGAISSATLKVVTNITAAGNYIIPVLGLASVRVVNTNAAGTVKVLGRLCN